ncbi:MAG: 3-deoxy-D-manno-octulosonic acid transferase [Planctomycetes bacterium]|nr:3-deoxy-D-manno-octulosonic acid transferase [Planctomycetota bacterium]
MRYVLNIIYLLLLLVLSPWLIYKALTTGKFRRGLWVKLTGRACVRETQASCAWFHGVSLGEIHLLGPVVAAFRKRHPDWQCVVSTTTDTGFEEATKRFADLPVFHWPLDFSWAVSRALRRVQPSLVVLAECELWPNFLSACKSAGVQVAVINGRMSPRSRRRFEKFRWLVSGLFRRLDLCAVQTEEHAAAFRSLGSPSVVVTGSVKYDGASLDRDNPRTRDMARLLDITPDDFVLVAGSTQAPEEQVILDTYLKTKARHANLRLILVPRHRERFDEVAALIDRAGVPFLRRSRMDGPAKRHDVMLSDTIGELSAIWGLADVAYVGGSLDGVRGGQNMIEPAAYGAAVLFGPHTWNFKDTVARLLEHGAAVQVADAGELENEVARLLGDAHARQELGEAARHFVFSQQGATAKTLQALDESIRESQVTSRAA